MAQNYRNLTLGIKNRLDPEHIMLTKAITDDLSAITYSDVVEYIRYAMNGVDPAYTQKSKDAGENVKTHLINGGIGDADFRYQGSVMTNTHIRGYSDIDLLVLSSRFYHYDYNEVNSIVADAARQARFYPTQVRKIITESQVSPYTGNGLEDLRELRSRSEAIMQRTYNSCDVSKPKSVKIKNTNLNREVDIVIANWYDDIASIISDKGINRGLQVYNKHLHQRGKVDFPFISIERINSRSAETGGRLKKMIRFLKNVKAESALQIDLSSFDFNAICYDIATTQYQSLAFYQLVPVLYLQLNRIAASQAVADNIMSVDGREPIFRGNPGKLQSLRNLMGEINLILTDLNQTRIL